MTNRQHLGRSGLSFLSQDPVAVASGELTVAAGTPVVRLNPTSPGRSGDKATRPRPRTNHTLLPQYIARPQFASNCHPTEVKSPCCCVLATCRISQQRLRRTNFNATSHIEFSKYISLAPSHERPLQLRAWITEGKHEGGRCT